MPTNGRTPPPLTLAQIAARMAIMRDPGLENQTLASGARAILTLRETEPRHALALFRAFMDERHPATPVQAFGSEDDAVAGCTRQRRGVWLRTSRWSNAVQPRAGCSRTASRRTMAGRCPYDRAVHERSSTQAWVGVTWHADPAMAVAADTDAIHPSGALVLRRDVARPPRSARLSRSVLPASGSVHDGLEPLKKWCRYDR